MYYKLAGEYFLLDSFYNINIVIYMLYLRYVTLHT